MIEYAAGVLGAAAGFDSGSAIAAAFEDFDTAILPDDAPWAATGDWESVTVTTSNGPPVATDDAYPTDGTTSVTVDCANGVLANDSDPDQDALSAYLVSGPSYGSLVLNSDGSFTYTPGPSFLTSDSFVYEARDGHGGVDQATVTINYAPDNSPPELLAPLGDVTAVLGTVQTSLDVSAVFGDSDVVPYGDILAFSVAANDNPTTVTAVLAGSTLTLTYASGVVGVASITIRATDSYGEFTEDTFAVRVIELPSAPVAIGNSYRVDHDGVLAVNASQGILANDFDPDGGTLQSILLSDPASGTVSLQPDGSFT